MNANKIRKSRPRPYKTLEGLRKQMQWGVLTGEEMVNGRATFVDGWHYNFKVTEEVEDEFWEKMAHVIWRRPSASQIRRLRYVKNWMLKRMHYSHTGFSYCAGQDYPYEIRAIQNCVNKM